MFRATATSLCLLLPVITSTSLSAQDSPASIVAPPANDEIPFAPLLAPSRLSINWPQGSMYEGDITVPLYLWSRTSLIEQLRDTLPEVSVRDCLGKSSKTAAALVPNARQADVMGSGCTLTFLPHFTFRQQKGGSAPVTTPTFNPALEFNIFILGLDTARTDRGVLDRDARSLFSAFRWLGMGARDTDLTGTLGAFHLRLAHYSNGQSGCLYTNQVYDPRTNTCIRVSDIPEALNVTDGSFSTHYVEVGATVAPIAFDETGVERRMMSLGYTIRSYPGGPLAEIGGMSSELARSYGRWEFGTSAMLRWRAPSSKGTWTRTVRTIRAEGACAYKRASQYDPCRGSVEALITWPALYGFGVSARYVAGWDPYNIMFGTTATNPRSGMPIISVVFDHSRAVTLTRAARARESR